MLSVGRQPFVSSVRYMRHLYLSLGIPIIGLVLFVSHRLVYPRLPLERRRGWLLFFVGFIVALFGGAVAVYLNNVRVGSIIAWWGAVASLGGMFWFFFAGGRGGK